MSEDPFAEFERSGGGWVIPIALFVLGAIPTTFAIRAIHELSVAEQPAGAPAEADGLENQEDAIPNLEVQADDAPNRDSEDGSNE